MDELMNLFTDLLSDVVGRTAVAIIAVSFIPFISSLINKNSKKSKKEEKREQTSEQYQTGWKWNEERQLWVHPKSEKGTTGKTQYSYRGSELYKVQPSKPIHFHHEDTSLTTQQKPKLVHDNNTNPGYSQRTKVDLSQCDITKQAVTQTQAHHVEIKVEESEIWRVELNKWKSQIEQNNIRKQKEAELEKSKTNTSISNTDQKISKTKESEYQGAYEAIPILTRNEFQNYKTLNDAANRKGYLIWSKVRLADLIKPHNTKNYSEYMSKFGKIKSKHVDFVVLDQNTKIKAIIELDDSSHDREDRKERDEFVDEILKDCGYKIIHTRYITPNVLDNI